MPLREPWKINGSEEKRGKDDSFNVLDEEN
jgi:hypothetical protein